MSRKEELSRHAFRFLDNGLCVLPFHNGQKNGKEIKKPLPPNFRQYRKKLPTKNTVQKWIDSDPTCELGFILGPISSNLCLFDFESQEIYERWAQAIEGKGLPKMNPVQAGIGIHIFFQSPALPQKRTILAKSKNPIEGHEPDSLGFYTLIEWLGKGCQVKYRISKNNPDKFSFPLLTEKQTEIALETARFFDERPEYTPESPKIQSKYDPTNHDLPGSDFNAKATADSIAEMLNDIGWFIHKREEHIDRIILRRPGKEYDYSGTITKSEHSAQYVFYNFSSNAHPFKPRECYSAFAVLAFCYYNEDFNATARYLKKHGYGKKTPETKELSEEEEEEYEEKYKPISIQEILQIPKPNWVAEPFILENTITVLYGEKSSYKSFFALDLGLHIASGNNWLSQNDCRVKQGIVIYIVGEGLGGMGQRIKAWMQYRKISELGAFFAIKHPVPLLEPAKIKQFIASIRKYELMPTVIIYDTLSWCLQGGDENAAEAMSQAVGSVRSIHEMFKPCSSLIIHHTRKDGETERGSSALRDNSDIIIEAKSDAIATEDQIGKGTILFHNVKDYEKPLNYNIGLEKITIENDDSEAETEDSLVICQAEKIEMKDYSERQPDERALVRVLVAFCPREGASTTLLEEMAREQLGIKRTACNKYIREAENKDFIKKVGGRKGKYVATNIGKNAIDPPF